MRLTSYLSQNGDKSLTGSSANDIMGLLHEKSLPGNDEVHTQAAVL
jgi:hypothetical protein